MMYKHFILTFSFGFLLILPLFSGDPVIRHLTPDDGLITGNIRDIAQDSSGLMWFATSNGLITYDGYSITNYRYKANTPDGLPTNICNQVFTDSKGQVWISTNKGICRYNPKRRNFIPYHEKGLEDSYNLKITETDSILFFSTTNDIYYYSLKKEDKIRRLDQPEGPFSLIEKTGDKLVILSNDGKQGKITYFKVISSGGKLILRSLQDYIFPEIIRDIEELPGDKLALATSKGIFQFDPVQNITIIIEDGNIFKLKYTSDNKLWYTSDKPGLRNINLIDGDKNILLHNSESSKGLVSNRVKCLFEDFSGNLWIGHYGRGLSILNLYQKKFNTVKKITDNDLINVMCFEEINDALLVGTFYPGIHLFKKHLNNSYENESLPYNNSDLDYSEYVANSWCIRKENNSTLWIGGNIGLIKATGNISSGYDFEQYLDPTITQVVRKIYLDVNDNMWIGSYQGLFLIPYQFKKQRKYYHYLPERDDMNSVSGSIITDFLLDSKGRFWISTQKNGVNLLKDNYATIALNRAEKPDLKFHHIGVKSKEEPGLNINIINCLFEHSNGSIWMGSEGGGINIFYPEENRFEYLTTEEGLAGDDIFGILSDSLGKIWVSTNRGLSSITYHRDYREIINYTHNDGIQGNVFMVNAYYKTKDGLLFFGGENGFTYFNPTDITKNNIFPKIRLNNLIVSGDEILPGDKIKKKIILHDLLNNSPDIILNHINNSFSIELASIHYENPAKNKIAYKLEGIDKDWTIMPANLKRVNYMSLKPGEYVFKAKAISADNLWSKEEKALNITILPPWWQTWYAYLAYILLFLLLTIGAFYLIIHRERLKNKVKLDLMEIENIKKSNEEKLVFFTNISHELLTPLSLISAPAQYILNKAKDYKDNQLMEQSGIIYRNAVLLQKLINQVIDFRKLNTGNLKVQAAESNIIEFVRGIINNMEPILTSKNIKMIYDPPSNPVHLWFDPDMMEKIINNLLTNAIKHTASNGLIVISIDEDKPFQIDPELPENWICLSVFNEGKEIPEDKANKIFERFYQIVPDSRGSGVGLSIAKSLAELHKGTIKYEPVSGKGVIFKVYLPLGDKHLSNSEKKQKETEIIYHDDEFLNDSIKTITLFPQTNPILSTSNQELMKVLVIEDNMELLSFFRTIFNKQYDFYQANDGINGLKLAKKIVPDVIVSDVMMPGLDGFEVCKRIKEDINTCHIPVLLLTAKGSSDQIATGYRSGADAYVTKPFEINLLFEQINRLIKNRELIHDKFRSQNFMIELSKEDNLSNKDKHFLQQVSEIIEENLTNPEFTIQKLAYDLDIGNIHLSRKLKALTGYSPKDLLKISRLNKAAELIKSDNLSIKEVCYHVGYNNYTYFLRSFKEHFNITPGEYKNEFKTGTN